MHLLGFTSLQDFINTLLGVKSWGINFFFACIAAISSFFSSYIYDSSEAVWFLILLFGADLMTGIYKSYIRRRDDGERGVRASFGAIKSNKLLRGFVSILMHLLLLGISWNMAKHNGVFFFLPSLVYGGIISTQFVSVLENLAEARILNSKLLNVILERIDITKIFKKKA